MDALGRWTDVLDATIQCLVKGQVVYFRFCKHPVSQNEFSMLALRGGVSSLLEGVKLSLTGLSKI